MQVQNLATCILFTVLMACLVSPNSSYASSVVTKVIYPDDEEKNDTRFNDLKEILKIALEKTVPQFGAYEMRPSTEKMNGLRFLDALKNAKEVNIVWSSTSEETENTFLPIRIPLRKGLLGYRVALILKSQQAKIDQIKTLNDLRKLSVGQGVGWKDIKLYEANGIKVEQAKYSNLFKMTAYGRFDLFPRGIGEIFSEFEQHSKTNTELAIEKNLLIYYPWPYYFFFNKQDIALHKRIETGLQIMMKDGSFDALFLKYNANAIKKINFKHRRIIKMNNYLLPKATPINDETLWFYPKMN